MQLPGFRNSTVVLIKAFTAEICVCVYVCMCVLAGTVCVCVCAWEDVIILYILVVFIVICFTWYTICHNFVFSGPWHSNNSK